MLTPPDSKGEPSAVSRAFRRARWRLDLPSSPGIARILIIKWGAMGDVVIATAAMEDIFLAFPGARIDLSTMPPWDQLFLADPRFERVTTYAARGADAGPAGLWRLAKAIRACSYDVIFDMQSNDRSRTLMLLLASMGGPKIRVGYHQRFPYTVAAPAPLPPVHASTYAHGMLRAAGVTPQAKRPTLNLDGGLRAVVESKLAAQGLVKNSFAVLMPGCAPAGHLKRWGTANYIDLVPRLSPRTVDKIVLIGGPDERQVCERIAVAHPNRVVNFCGTTSLADIVAISERSRFIVSNDTGTAHLASASGQPLWVICGPTDPRRVRPLGDAVRTCQVNLPCINCYRKVCAHHACMALLTPDVVAAEVIGVIEEPPQDLARTTAWNSPRNNAPL